MFSNNRNNLFSNINPSTGMPNSLSSGTPNSLASYSLTQANNSFLPSDMQRSYSQQFVNNTRFSNPNEAYKAQEQVNKQQLQSIINIGRKK